jgi:hypothetical protein
MLRFLSLSDIVAALYFLAPKSYEHERVLSEENEGTYSLIEDLSKIEEVFYLSSMVS